jgi:hypothetical protein
VNVAGTSSAMSVSSESLESVTINIMPSNNVAPSSKLNGLVHQLASKSLTLITGEEIPVPADVTVQSRDLLFLGEVLSCVPNDGAKWTTYVRVKRSLLVV